MNQALVGAPRLLRLALRRDRVLLPVWVAALVLSSVSSVQATVDLYPDAASRVEAAAGINDNPAAGRDLRAARRRHACSLHRLGAGVQG